MANTKDAMVSGSVTLFEKEHTVIDLTVPIAENVPSWYSYGQPFLKVLLNWFDGIRGHMRSFVYTIEEHTGTHCDAPIHTIPDEGSGFPWAGPAGSMSVDKVPVSMFMGEAAVIDVTDLSGTGEPGMSPIIKVGRVKDWEKKHGSLKKGDVPIFYTGWTDRYYKPFPEGFKLERDCRLLKKTGGWPAPDEEVMDYLASKGIVCMGVDTVSLGSIQDDDPPHWHWHSKGCVNIEKLVNVGLLPPRGAYFIFLPLKVVGGTGSPGRAIAIL